MSILRSHKPLLMLMIRYGLVGVLATAVHYLIGLFFHKLLHWSAFWAHFIGFIGGLFIAYIGHYYFSFQDSEKHQKRFPKFVVTALTGLLLHQTGVYFLVNIMFLDYATQAAPVVLICVPLVTFLMSKIWVFSDP